MSTATAATGLPAAGTATKPGPVTALVIVGLLEIGILFTGYSGEATTTLLICLLLCVAQLIALGFEFVKGFHDTANAVAAVNHVTGKSLQKMSPRPAPADPRKANGECVRSKLTTPQVVGALAAAILLSGCLYRLFVHLF